MTSRTLRVTDVCIDQELPSIRMPATITSVMATALATRDYQPVHHDLERARALGNDSVFTNTHTAAGYLEHLVMKWAGPDAFLRRLKLRLGVPNYAGDELVVTGKVTAIDLSTHCATVAAVGRNSLGDHVTAELVVELQGAANV